MLCWHHLLRVCFFWTYPLQNFAITGCCMSNFRCGGCNLYQYFLKVISTKLKLSKLTKILLRFKWMLSVIVIRFWYFSKIYLQNQQVCDNKIKYYLIKWCIHHACSFLKSDVDLLSLCIHHEFVWYIKRKSYKYKVLVLF